MAHDLNTYFIAAMIEKSNESHGAAKVGEMMQKVFLSRCKLDLKKELCHCSSDTCTSANNVGGVIGANQEDYEKHVVNLCIISSTFAAP